MTKIGGFRPSQPKPRRGAGAAPRAGTAVGGVAGAQGQGVGAGFALPSRIDAAVIDAIQRLAGDDPERPVKAFKLFLAHALKAELAHHALSPAVLQSLTDTTWERMREDPQLREEIARAQEALLDLAGPRKA